jgi:hypothetical protein
MTQAGAYRLTTRAVVLLAATVLGLGAPAAQAADPRLAPLEGSSSLRPGGAARLAAKIQDLGACRLTLRVGHRVTRSSISDAEGASEIVWRWRVPRRTRSAGWHATVACWLSRAPVPAGGVDRRRTFAGAIVAPASGPAALVAGDRLVAEARRAAPLASPRSALENAASWATIGGVVLTLAGLVFVLLGLRANRNQRRSEYTSRILERYLNRDFINLSTKVLELLSAPDERTSVQMVRRWERADHGSDNLLTDADPSWWTGEDAMRAVSRNDVAEAMFFYEEVSALLNRAELDRVTVERTFGDTLPQSLEAFWWFILYERDGCRRRAHPRIDLDGESEYYAEWEQAVLTMALVDPGLEIEGLNGPGNDDLVRALCLPPEGSADEPTWDRCAELSRVIGNVLRGPRDDGDPADEERRIQQLRATLAQARGGAAPASPTGGDPRTRLVPRWKWHLQRPARLSRARLAIVRRRWRIARLATLHAWCPWRWLRAWAAGRIARVADGDVRVRYHRRYQELGHEIDATRAAIGDAATLDAVRLAFPQPA